jgi:serine protein kinase
MYNDSLFNAFARSFEARSQTDMSMAEYLESCRSDPMRYANSAERLLAAIGQPRMIDTAKDPRLGRIFLNRTLLLYPAFAGFYGMEETIERIVGFFRHAAQGLEERKQILYLLGPVGGGNSSLAERLKSFDGNSSDLRGEARRRTQPGFRKSAQPVRSGIARADDRGKVRHPRRRLTGLMSPWRYKRLESFGGDISQFPRRQYSLVRASADIEIAKVKSGHTILRRERLIMNQIVLLGASEKRAGNVAARIQQGRFGTVSLRGKRP